jgi:hypothetical protein
MMSAEQRRRVMRRNSNDDSRERLPTRRHRAIGTARTMRLPLISK